MSFVHNCVHLHWIIRGLCDLFVVYLRFSCSFRYLFTIYSRFFLRFSRGFRGFLVFEFYSRFLRFICVVPALFAIFSWFSRFIIGLFSIYSRLFAIYSRFWRFICNFCVYSLFFRGSRISCNVAWNTIKNSLIWNLVHFDYLYTLKNNIIWYVEEVGFSLRYHFSSPCAFYYKFLCAHSFRFWDFMSL
jgi:hypothetical protein